MRTVKTVKTVKMEDTWIPVVSGDSKDELAQNVKLIASKKRKLFARNIIVVMLIATCCFGFVFFVYRCFIFGNTHNSRNSERGYYKYQDTTFYYQDGVWYEYDAALGWIYAAPDDAFLEDYRSYYNGTMYENQNGVTDFSGSGYYRPNNAEGSNYFDGNTNQGNSGIMDFDEEMDRE